MTHSQRHTPRAETCKINLVSVAINCCAVVLVLVLVPVLVVVLVVLCHTHTHPASRNLQNQNL